MRERVICLVTLAAIYMVANQPKEAFTSLKASETIRFGGFVVLFCTK